MIVMPSNATGIAIGYLSGKYPGKLGHLYSPGAQRGPWPFMPYALDNGAWGAFARGVSFRTAPWRELLAWARNSGQAPRWVLVPDAVGNCGATLNLWKACHAEAATVGAPLAFAAQDGMTPADVPGGASVVFLGGSTEWKWSHLFEWCAAFPRVHVGRVNGLRQLRLCARAGAESCDGTGFSRTLRQWNELARFLAEQAGEVQADDQTSALFDSADDPTEAGSMSASIGVRAPTGDEST
jgi:hypothetical protein